MGLTGKSVRECMDLLSGKEISPEELTQAYLDRIGQDKELNGYISVFDEQALESSRQSGAGIPIAVKDNICIRGTRTTCGSKILEDFQAPYDAHVIELLRKQNLVFLGKTNMDEFAMGSSTETSFFGPTLNPADRSCVPGGSSGGSAAVVAAGQAPWALGSDTGGSIRQPAAFCGVVGLKPTYGLVSRFGLVAYGSSLDQIGPLARTVEDAALLLNLISGHDERDSTSVKRSSEDYSAGLRKGVKGLKIGLPKEYMIDGLNPEVREAVERSARILEKSGALISEVSLPNTEYAIAVYYIIAPSEASSNLSRYDGVRYGFRSADREAGRDLLSQYTHTRSEGFGDEVKRRILLGTFSLSSGYYDAYYLKAQKARTLIRRDFDQALERVDCLLAPVSPTPAFRLGEKAGDPLTMYLSDIFTISANLAGIPGLTVPAGKNSQGLPLAVQLLGGPFQESLLLQVGYNLEKMTGSFWEHR